MIAAESRLLLAVRMQAGNFRLILLLLTEEDDNDREEKEKKDMKKVASCFLAATA